MSISLYSQPESCALPDKTANAILFYARSLSRHQLTFVVPMLAAGCVTAVLFWVMLQVVAQEDIELAQPQPAPSIDLVRLLPDEPIVPPPVNDPPNPVDPPPKVITPTTEVIGLEITPTLISPPRLRPTVAAQGRADGDLAALLTVAPDYPRRQLQQGVEGWVLIQFSVDELGRVINPEVVQAEPASVFNQAALKAVQRYKYRPRIVNGVAMTVHGVQQRILFELQ